MAQWLRGAAGVVGVGSARAACPSPRPAAQVWPGATHFPDFRHPNTSGWWGRWLEDMHRRVPYSGLWLDMNEISNFCTGWAAAQPLQPLRLTLTLRNWLAAALLLLVWSSASQGPPCARSRREVCERSSWPHWLNNCKLSCRQPDPEDPLAYPPYSINAAASKRPLHASTLPMSARHHGGELQYNLHNMNGLLEVRVTHLAMRRFLGKRPFILSRWALPPSWAPGCAVLGCAPGWAVLRAGVCCRCRCARTHQEAATCAHSPAPPRLLPRRSTFPSIGRWAAHWTGDNAATWNDLRWSIQGLLQTNMWGIPMAGSDICGFYQDTSEELCARWAGRQAPKCRRRPGLPPDPRSSTGLLHPHLPAPAPLAPPQPARRLYPRAQVDLGGRVPHLCAQPCRAGQARAGAVPLARRGRGGPRGAGAALPPAAGHLLGLPAGGPPRRQRGATRVFRGARWAGALLGCVRGVRGLCRGARAVQGLRCCWPVESERPAPRQAPRHSCTCRAARCAPAALPIHRAPGRPRPAARRRHRGARRVHAVAAG
jgi:hypothetical protein